MSKIYELDKAMAELCARLREYFESAGHPICPDPECDYTAYENYENTEHAANCAYIRYVKAQDAAIDIAHANASNWPDFSTWQAVEEYVRGKAK